MSAAGGCTVRVQLKGADQLRTGCYRPPDLNAVMIHEPQFVLERLTSPEVPERVRFGKPETISTPRLAARMISFGFQFSVPGRNQKQEDSEMAHEFKCLTL